MTRTAMLGFALVAAGFGVSQAGAVSAPGDAHSVALPVGTALPAGDGSGEGPNR